ncbi:MAG: YciI family protein [Chloroflexota bacterium]|nr:YciI family protein [Chloroflexota bacterium]
MRVVVLVKATADSEAGFMPSTELIAAMGAYNEELVNAGIMLDGDGFKPTSQGVRITFDGDSRTVVNGPFASPNELVAGYWIWQVKDMDEAIEWAKRAPNPMPGPSDLEIRPLYEPEDFGAAFTEELREQDSQLRDRLADR